MSDARSRKGRLAFSAALVLLAAAAGCGGRFESSGENTGGTGGSGAGSGTGGASGGGAGGASGGGAGGDSGSSGRAGSGGNSGSGGVSGSGGASGSAGSGAVGGSGGSGGSGPCVQGGACATEGATCSEASCCPCSYRCMSGHWQISLCPSCPAPYCQDPAPANGEPCSTCFTPSNGCVYESCPSAPRVFARCENDRWNVRTEPCTGGCCTGDAQCGAGNVCASTVCKPNVSDGCWRDLECGAGNFCSGAFVCPCNADCAYQDSLGQCVPNDMGCCRTDDGCMTGYECVAGMCKLKLAVGFCWSNRDCQGKTCKNAQVCPCGTACALPDVMGECL